MVRTSKGRSNTSILNVTNASLVEEPAPEVVYSEFIKNLMPPEPQHKFIGYEDIRSQLKAELEDLHDVNIDYTNRVVLLTGSRGCGKTTLVRELAQDSSNLSFFYLRSSWILRREIGKSLLKSLFDEAKEKAPSLIFIDDIEKICSKKKHVSDSLEMIFNVLEDELEDLQSTSNRVLLIASSEDPDIRKPCHISSKIRMTLPKQSDREQIIKSITNKFSTRLRNEQIEELASATPCYSYQDLRELARKAKDLDSIKVALTKFKPDIVESVVTPCPPLKWTDIGGVEDTKQALREAVIWPIMQKDNYKKYGLKPKKGALLYGPPGCSKTMLAQALATESGYNFISIKGPELNTKWVGDTEAAVRKLYRNAREIAPCVIFFDEIDGFAAKRSESSSSTVNEKVVTTLLTELDQIGPQDNVFTIAATNRPAHIDTALLRPGRINPAIYIPLPSGEDRKEIFKVHMRHLPIDFEHDSLNSLVEKLSSATDGYSGAEIAEVCQTAGTMMLRESKERITFKHFQDALKQVEPGTFPEDLVEFDRFRIRKRRKAIDTSSLETAISEIALD